MELKQNPFYILGVSMTANKRKILEAADDKMLIVDENIVEEAKNALLDSRKRLDAELAWFPFLDHDKENALIFAIDNNFSNSNSLGRMIEYDEVNFQLAMMQNRHFEKMKLPYLFGDDSLILSIKFEKYADPHNECFFILYNKINIIRQGAGFPEISKEELLSHLDSRRAEIVADLKNIINDLPVDYIKFSLIHLAESATHCKSSIRDRANLLVEALIETYEIEIQTFLNQQREKIYELFDTILGNTYNEHSMNRKLEQYCDKITNYTILWSGVVKPIQVISLSKGEEHIPTYHILLGVRKVVSTVYKDLDMPELSLNMLGKLYIKGAFEYMPSFHKKVSEDIDILWEIVQNNRHRKRM